jgi:hypothetical protein
MTAPPMPGSATDSERSVSERSQPVKRSQSVTSAPGTAAAIVSRTPHGNIIT